MASREEPGHIRVVNGTSSSPLKGFLQAFTEMTIVSTSFLPFSLSKLIFCDRFFLYTGTFLGNK